MCSGVSGWCAPADVEPQSWWIRYTSIPPHAQMAADGASFPPEGCHRRSGIHLLRPVSRPSSKFSFGNDFSHCPPHRCD